MIVVVVVIHTCVLSPTQKVNGNIEKTIFLGLRVAALPASSILPRRYLARQLGHRRRYEVFQQPTDFWLDSCTPDHILDVSDLKTSLGRYNACAADSSAREPALLLRFRTEASYYSTNRTLRLCPPENPDIVALLLSGYIYYWPLSVTTASRN
ncbi:hypothetical protein PSV08DRAFT_373622 [Bipolaris maydis]|uniref:uncharacterized protein n=1 Tax=Cochliobolus heterostrophus TaxID=5016 RepID=UPI0024D489BD|nr:hypothetical protein PSV08DRAFT_373622 [Bipolaris maydis]